MIPIKTGPNEDFDAVEFAQAYVLLFVQDLSITLATGKAHPHAPSTLYLAERGIAGQHSDGIIKAIAGMTAKPEKEIWRGIYDQAQALASRGRLKRRGGRPKSKAA